jgi:hypothetical protein
MPLASELSQERLLPDKAFGIDLGWLLSHENGLPKGKERIEVGLIKGFWSGSE